MPTWKIAGYHFYFRSGEPLKKNEPAHVHIRGAKHGKIQFWLERTDTKSKDEIKIKKLKGQVSDKEKNEIEVIVRKNKRMFLEEWNRRKAKNSNLNL